MNGIESGRIGTKREAVLSIQDLDRVQDIAEKIYIDAAIKEYIANIVNMTRHPELISNGRLANYIRTGASPRASINFLRIAKAEALISGRTYVVPDDVKNMRHQVLRHRIGLNYAAVVDNISVEEIIDMLVNAVPTP